MYLTLLKFYGNNVPFSPSLRNFVEKVFDDCARMSLSIDAYVGYCQSRHVILK